jgi:hypothetical protein
MKITIIPSLFGMFLPLLASAELETGEQINLTLRGVDSTEQSKITATYRVAESGAVRLPSDCHSLTNSCKRVA